MQVSQKSIFRIQEIVEYVVIKHKNGNNFDYYF